MSAFVDAVCFLIAVLYVELSLHKAWHRCALEREPRVALVVPPRRQGY